MVDTIIVGRFLGVNALAGVGSTGSLNFLIIGFCMGVCNGFAIPLAHMFGAKDYSGLRRFMANGVWLSILFFSGDDSAHNGFLPSDADGNEDSGGYLCPCLWLYFYYILGDSGYVFV